ncbi:MAG: hypothetical protein UW45_C0047G0001 [Parcubacteria group bacterium GW2011_GWC2_44_22]|nr:MAG: hypothetical protein UW45_C0047G0001 [Parcubacteria group bacterium GW2011_GWC2_44_22]
MRTRIRFPQITTVRGLIVVAILTLLLTIGITLAVIQLRGKPQGANGPANIAVIAPETLPQGYKKQSLTVIGTGFDDGMTIFVEKKRLEGTAYQKSVEKSKTTDYLTATLPPGLRAGQYDVSVQSGKNTIAKAEKGLTITGNSYPPILPRQPNWVWTLLAILIFLAIAGGVIGYGIHKKNQAKKASAAQQGQGGTPVITP